MDKIVHVLKQARIEIIPLYLLAYFYICVNVLSFFNCIFFSTLLLIAIPPIIPLGVIIRHNITKLPMLWKKENSIWLVLAPILALILISGLSYAPNNHDSMTYHLARIVHWLQNRNVAYYQTYCYRQDVSTPAAEYLLMVWQGTLKTDALDFALQFFLYLFSLLLLNKILLKMECAPLARKVAVLIAAATPMAVLQASSTQNDIAAAYCALCILYFALLIGENRMKWNNLIGLAIAISIGYLVKPTAVLAVIPFLLFYFFRFFKNYGWSKELVYPILVFAFINILLLRLTSTGAFIFQLPCRSATIYCSIRMQRLLTALRILSLPL